MVMRIENPNGYKCVIFDLDETIIDNRIAWCHTLTESILSVIGQRIDPKPLLAEYRTRYWEDVISLFVDNQVMQKKCLNLCHEMERRSSLKHLLVFEGIGMTLDKIRDLADIGVISRWSHREATKRIQSTGLDRFFTGTVGTLEKETWDAGQRFSECCNFLGYKQSDSLYIGAEQFDLDSVILHGGTALSAGWAGHNGSLRTSGSLTALVQAGPRH